MCFHYFDRYFWELNSKLNSRLLFLLLYLSPVRADVSRFTCLYFSLRNRGNFLNFLSAPEVDEVVVVLIFSVKEHSQMARVHSGPSHEVVQIN